MTRRDVCVFSIGWWAAVFPKVTGLAKADKVEPVFVGEREITLLWLVRWDREMTIFYPEDRLTVLSACPSWKAALIQSGKLAVPLIVPIWELEQHSKPI